MSYFKINAQSHDVMKCSADLFAEPPTEVSTIGSYWNIIQTKSVLGDHTTPIDFELPASENFADFTQAFFYFRIVCMKEDGTEIKTTDKVYPVTNFGQSMINQLDMYMNETLITTSNNNYAIRAHLETLLGHSRDFAKSQGTTSLFKHVLHPNQIDGTAELQEYFTDGKEIEFTGKLHTDIMQQTKLMVNHMPIRIHIKFNPPSFLFNTENASAKPTYKIKEAMFAVRMQQQTAKYKLDVEQQLQTKLIPYYVNHVEVIRHNIAKGAMNFNFPNTFSGQIPDKVIAVFVSAAGQNGDYTKNPFNYQHYNITKIKSTVNGVSRPFENLYYDYDPKKPRTLMPFQFLLFALGWANNPAIALPLDRSSYLDGHAIHIFDIRQAPDEETGFGLLERGDMTLDGTFQTGLPESVNAIFYAQWPAVITVNRDRAVQYNYTT